jgi:adenine-specific DNA-methyltransferase
VSWVWVTVFLYGFRYEITIPDGTKIKPKDNNNGRKACWRWSKDKLDWGLKNGFIEFGKDRLGNWTVYTKQYLNCDNEGNKIERTQRPFGIIDKFSSTQAAKLMEKMGFGSVFNYLN